MANDEQGEKTEQPTQKRRRDSREKGQVARSNDLSGSVVLLAGCALLLVVGGWSLDKIVGMCTYLFANLDTIDISTKTVNAHAWNGGWNLAMALAPLLAVIFLVAFAVTAGQVGFHISGKALTPDLNRLNPIKGMGKLVSIRSVVKLLTGLMKMAAVGGVVALVLYTEVPQIIALLKNLSVTGNTTPQVAAFIAQETLLLGLYASITLVALAVIDYSYQRWQHTDDIKMTKQEVKDEMRNMEGDPQVRKRRQEAQRKLSQSNMMHEAKSAHVMVTNPTHITIAIRYKEEDSAPMVVAKGADHLAMKLRELAKEHDIPIVERKELARAMYRYVEVGERVPEKFWKAVAEILAFIWRSDEEMKRRLLSQS
jgi:flagellar biosynthetic protein FlhB